MVNPISGNRSGEQDWSAISMALRERGVAVNTIVTFRSGQARELLLGADTLLAYDVLVVIGGDGFLHEVLNAVLLQDFSVPKPLAIVPSGTGNGTATSLGIRTAVDAATSLLAGTTSALDLMEVVVNDESRQVIAATLSVGWGAIADHDALAERTLRGMPMKALLVPAWIILRANTYRGRVSFVPHPRQGDIASGNLHARDPTSGRVVIDDTFNLVHVCNLPWIASDCLAAPGSKPDDGCVGILILRGASRLDLVRMFLAAESGMHTSHPAVELYWATEVTISPTAGPCGLGNITVDGELIAPVSVDIKCRPSAVQVVQGLPAVAAQK
uniref:DAGKc domain-containing protein n=1 Tax=Coccolithus braarudii TaxID=221442 RepID=A0A7S0Q9S0_9EUKA